MWGAPVPIPQLPVHVAMKILKQVVFAVEGWLPRCNFVHPRPWTSTGHEENPGLHHHLRSSMSWHPATQPHLIWLRKRTMKLWTLKIEHDLARQPLCQVLNPIDVLVILVSLIEIQNIFIIFQHFSPQEVLHKHPNKSEIGCRSIRKQKNYFIN